ncbi:MAG: DNA topoisomerase IV subunit A [Planctomycetota bacterium]
MAKSAPAAVMTAADKRTAKQIDEIATQIVKAAQKQADPKLSIPVRSLSNVKFSEKKKIIEMMGEKQDRLLFNLSTAKKFMQTVLVADKVKNHLLSSGKTTSIRDMFYMIKHTMGHTKENTVDDQVESDAVIEDLEVTLEALREELHLHASNKGAMVGPLTLTDSGDTIDLRRMGSGGWSVPSIVEPGTIKFGKCEAKYILLIEKDAMWRRFNEDKYWKEHNCIIIHGGGQPPRGVRRLLYRMHNELKLPVYVFADNDPWGYYIYSVVKQGSINLAYESQRMAIPDARFLGLSSFDFERFDLGRSACIKLNDEDRKRAKEIAGYPWFSEKKPWQKEIAKMLSNQFKMELEALSGKSLSFVTEEYLPKKIKDKAWLD